MMSTSPLEGLRYARRAHDLVRFTADPVDEAIARVVRGAFTMSDAQRDAIRRSMREDHAYTLLLFAKRRSASALRSRTLAHALEAVQALTLVTRDRDIDYRDLSVDFPLYAARILGADMHAVVRDAMAASEPGVAGCFTARAGSIPEMTLESCALMEVRSSYGLGFMFARGAHTASVDLANCAVQFADAVDAEGTSTLTFKTTPVGTIQAEVKGMSMRELARELTSAVGRPVVDRTGLAGRYHFTLEIPLADQPSLTGRGAGAAGGGPAGGASDPRGMTMNGMVDAVQRLGLRLESDRVQVDTIVVEKMSRTPTPD